MIILWVRRFEYSLQLKAHNFRALRPTPLMNCPTKEIHKSYQSVSDTKSVIEVTGMSALARVLPWFYRSRHRPRRDALRISRIKLSRASLIMCRKHGPIISSVPATPGLNILAVCGHSPVELERKKGQEEGTTRWHRIFQQNFYGLQSLL